MQERSWLGLGGLFRNPGQLIVLHHRVTEEVFTDGPQLTLQVPRGLAINFRELNLHDFADAHAGYAAQAQLSHGLFHGYALGIEHFLTGGY
jgi:hypothetical protein